MKNKPLLFVFLFLVLTGSAFAVETQFGENYQQTCDGGSCSRTIYGGPVFYRLSNGTWVNSEDAIIVSYDDGVLNITYPDKQESVLYDTLIIVNGTEYRLGDYVGQVPGSSANVISKKYKGGWLWYANISGLGPVMNSVDSIAFRKISSTRQEESAQEIKQYGRLKVDFRDLISSGYVLSSGVGEITLTNVTGKPNLVLDPSVLLTGSVANLTGKCGQKASVAAINPYPAGTVNASQTWYDNIGAVDDVIAKFNNNGVNECDGGANYVIGQLNWTLKGINAAEVDSFNFTYVHGAAWDYNMVISIGFWNTSANDWTDYLRRNTPNDANVPYWASINLTKAQGAGNLFADNGADSNFIVVMNSSMGNTHGIQFDYVSLTVAWTEQSGVTEAQARAAIEIGVNSSLSGASVSSYQKIYGRNLSNSQIQGTFDKFVAYGAKRWAFNYVNASESFVRMYNLTPVLYVLEMSNLPVNTIINDTGSLINAPK